MPTKEFLKVAHCTVSAHGSLGGLIHLYKQRLSLGPDRGRAGCPSSLGRGAGATHRRPGQDTGVAGLQPKHQCQLYCKHDYLKNKQSVCVGVLAYSACCSVLQRAHTSGRAVTKKLLISVRGTVSCSWQRTYRGNAVSVCLAFKLNKCCSY